jgi:translation initiation factor 2B subunit (eIF-2B alpha/beta/delta family)
VAGTNLLLAAIAVAIALNARPGRADEELAQKIRDQATEEITKDVDEIREEIQRVSDEIAGIRAGVASMRDAVPNVKAVVDLASSVKKKLDDSG